VPGVAGREPLPLEDVPEMTAAPRALNLYALAICVGKPPDRPRNLLVEGRPSAVGIELVFRPVQRGPAPLALVRPGSELTVILTGKWGFGALVEDYSFLGSREGTKGRRRGIGHTRLTGKAY
jgi:hypothetical protein